MIEIILVDYISPCDKNGKPIGHPLPTLRQAFDLLSPMCKVTCCASRKYRPYINVEYQLPFATATPKNRGLKSIINTAKKLINLMFLPKAKKGRFFFFTNIDINLFFLARIFKNRETSFSIRLFENFEESSGYIGRMKKNIFLASAQNFKRTFISNEMYYRNSAVKNSYFIPDYFYSDEKFGKYIVRKKTNNWSLSIGVMNKDKDIIGLLKSFEGHDVKLMVAGSIIGDAPTRIELDNAAQRANAELIIDNLSEEKYFGLIADARFVILPYKKETYFNRPSGILLESVFLETPLIVPSFGVFKTIQKFELGLLYNDLDEIPSLIKGTSLSMYERYQRNMREYKQLFNISNYRNSVFNALTI